MSPLIIKKAISCIFQPISSQYILIKSQQKRYSNKIQDVIEVMNNKET